MVVEEETMIPYALNFRLEYYSHVKKQWRTQRSNLQLKKFVKFTSKSCVIENGHGSARRWITIWKKASFSPESSYTHTYYRSFKVGTGGMLYFIGPEQVYGLGDYAMPLDFEEVNE